MMPVVKSVLVAEDEPLTARFITALLSEHHVAWEHAADGADAVERLPERAWDAVFTDLKMPRLDGFGVLRAVRQRSPRTPVVMMTGYESVATAVSAMKEGCHDFLVKPLDADQVDELITRLLGPDPDIPEVRHCSAGAIVGCDEQLQQACRLACRVADSSAPVLVQGESGTGKELIARLLHESGARASAPFVAVNCSALSEPLLESELFGHERGGFTGAVETRKGCFERADGGTLFLDEISETSLRLQAKLLRVLEYQQFERVGGSHPVTVDVRVVSATNRDLAEEIAQGEFRADLFFRLNVVPIVLPPLRERQGDIPLLLEHFIQEYAEEAGRPITRVDSRTLDGLTQYDWPGNVRELENFVRLHILTGEGSTFTAPAPSPWPRQGGQTCVHGRTLAEVERQLILSTLRETGGNRTEAARRLGVVPRTVRKKLAEYRAQGLMEVDESWR